MAKRKSLPFFSNSKAIPSKMKKEMFVSKDVGLQGNVMLSQCMSPRQGDINSSYQINPESWPTQNSEEKYFDGPTRFYYQKAQYDK